MTKIFTKISLLFIGLMLCAGNAWGQGFPGISMVSYQPNITVDGITYNLTTDMTEWLLNNNPLGIKMSAKVVAVDCSIAVDENIEFGQITMPAKVITIPTTVYYNNNFSVDTIAASFSVCNESLTIIKFTPTANIPICVGASANGAIAMVPSSALTTYQATTGWTETFSTNIFTWNDGGGSGGDTPEDPEPTSDEGDFGAEGNNLHWVFDGEHTLTISGTGAMEDFEESSWWGDVAPWMDYKSSIQTVVIENGVTTVSTYAFCGCSAMETLTIPSSLTTVAGYAMQGCSGLTTINTENSTSPCSLNDYTFGFSSISQEITVNVPAGYAAAYEAAWSRAYNNFNFVEELSDAIEFTNGNATTTINALSAHAGETFTDFTMARPIQANGKLNTLCLPFNMSKEQIANSDLADATIYEFTGEGNITGSSWDLEFTSVSTVKAGTPYLFAFEDADPSTPNLTELVFHDVTIVSNIASLNTSSATYNNLIFKGTLNATEMTTVGHTYYFLGSNNALTWATGGSVYPFRAYFEDLAPGTRPVNAPARIVLGRNTATAIEDANTKELNTQKVLENNQVIIIRNGIRYNIAGQVVK